MTEDEKCELLNQGICPDCMGRFSPVSPGVEQCPCGSQIVGVDSLGLADQKSMFAQIDLSLEKTND